MRLGYNNTMISTNEYITMATNAYKFQTNSSTLKTYSTYENAEKAFSKMYGDVDLLWIVVMLTEKNSSNPKYYGKFIPVAIGKKWIEETNVHFNFNIIT